MKHRVVLVTLMVIAATLGVTGPASAAPASGSFTTTLTVEPTMVGTTTVSGSITANVTQFRLEQGGRVVAVATVSGTLSATDPAAGAGTIVITGTRVVLNADVTADCSGNLRIDFRGALQLNATVTLTTDTGLNTTKTLSETLPLRGTLNFTAEDTAQEALICDISKILSSRASGQALVDKLTTLLKHI